MPFFSASEYTSQSRSLICGVTGPQGPSGPQGTPGISSGLIFYFHADNGGTQVANNYDGPFAMTTSPGAGPGVPPGKYGVSPPSVIVLNAFASYNCLFNNFKLPSDSILLFSLPLYKLLMKLIIVKNANSL